MNSGEYSLYFSTSNFPSVMIAVTLYGNPMLSNDIAEEMGMKAVLKLFVTA